jgi:hypothetical protein
MPLASPLRRAASTLPLALLVAAVAGCPGRTNIVSVTQHLSVQPVPGDSFAGYTSTTFGESIDSGKKIYLRDATVTSSSGEFSWLGSMSATTPADQGGTLVLSRASFAGTSATADLDINYKGDLHPFYPDGQHFVIDWAWDFTDSFAQSYPNGLTLTFNYTLDVE